MTNIERWPDFIIIGAAKCGTTSLYHYLRRHPDVFMPEIKELDYFDPTHPQGIHDRDQYLAAFAGSEGRRIAGEASPAYLSSEVSAGIIRETLGDGVKLVAVLRNPVDMMYSSWAHSVRGALESRPAAKALLESLRAPWDPNRWFECHAARARYDEQIARYFARFPRRNIAIYLFEEFFQPGLPQFQDLCDFLGVARFTPLARTVHNKGFLPRSQSLNRFVHEHYGRFFLPVAKRLVPASVRHAVRRRLDDWNEAGAVPVPPLDPELRSQLEDGMRRSVRKLEELLDRDLKGVWF